MRFVLQIWRQQEPRAAGAFRRYEIAGITPDMSFLEMLDALNEQLAANDEAPVAFASDCREGICGECGMMINGAAHGPIGGMAASAALFTGAKITHLALMPQGHPERPARALSMVARMDEEGFGNCTWHGECQAACPKAISSDTIARLNREWVRASLAESRVED